MRLPIPAALIVLAAAPGAVSAAPQPVPVEPGLPPAVTNGAFRMGADALWAEGITGDGQVVAVLDVGFAGLDDAIAAGELPARAAMTIRSFDPDNGIDGRNPVGEATGHGVRMAEIVHDVAPGARLLMANYNTEAQFREAVAWAVAAGAGVVSHSNSFLTPPFDGTGPNARAVDGAARAGVLWVNSAGNFAQRHWRGTVAPGRPVRLEVTSGPADPLAFALARLSGDGELTLELERADAGGEWMTVETLSAGTAGALSAVRPAGDDRWRITLRAAGGDVAVRLFSRTAGFGAAGVADRSIPTPGDAAGSVSVAAVPWTGESIAPYSSHGPTLDGRAKPDLAAPTYVTANRAWPGTAGTSAAAAHLAGAAILLRARRAAAGESLDPGLLRAELTASAGDLGAPGPDPIFGAGIVRLDTRAPEISARTSGGRVPLVRAQARDAGTIASMTVSVDGRTARSVRAARILVPLRGLDRGRHRVVVTARDLAGNGRSHARWVVVP